MIVFLYCSKKKKIWHILKVSVHIIPSLRCLLWAVWASPYKNVQSLLKPDNTKTVSYLWAIVWDSYLGRDQSRHRGWNAYRGDSQQSLRTDCRTTGWIPIPPLTLSVWSAGDSLESCRVWWKNTLKYPHLPVALSAVPERLFHLLIQIWKQQKPTLSQPTSKQANLLFIIWVFKSYFSRL